MKTKMNLKEYLEYISNNWNNYREHCISKNKKGNLSKESKSFQISIPE